MADSKKLTVLVLHNGKFTDPKDCVKRNIDTYLRAYGARDGYNVSEIKTFDESHIAVSAVKEINPQVVVFEPHLNKVGCGRDLNEPSGIRDFLEPVVNSGYKGLIIAYCPYGDDLAQCCKKGANWIIQKWPESEGHSRNYFALLDGLNILLGKDTIRR